MTGKDHETREERREERQEAHASHGARSLQAGLQKAGVHVVAVVEPPDGGTIILTLQVGLEVKDFSFATEDATPEAVLAAFRSAGGIPTPQEPPEAAKA